MSTRQLSTTGMSTKGVAAAAAQAAAATAAAATATAAEDAAAAQMVERVSLFVAARGLAAPKADTFAALYAYDDVNKVNEFLGSSVRSTRLPFYCC
jgi:hypothetical protein